MINLYGRAIENAIANKYLNDSTYELKSGEYAVSNQGKCLTYETDTECTLEVEYDGDISDINLEKINIDSTGKISFTVALADGTEYTYGTQTSDEETTSVLFATDDWSTIVANGQVGNTSAYNVGDEKEVTLTGDVAGTYTVRIANNSTPEECSTEGFSQTACGFVIEFVDIITTYTMNSSSTNVGGWEASKMRTYINGTIYDSFPEELKNSIINTTVVSGHGSTSGETNFTTTDKLYLLSTKEVWGTVATNDTLDEETR